MKLKIDDQVKVTLGKDGGKIGKVEKVLPKKNAVMVAGINVYKKHVKASGQDKPGGIVDITKPLNVSKVSLICPKCHKTTRVGYRLEKNQKLRVCRKCDKVIDSKKSKK